MEQSFLFTDVRNSTWLAYVAFLIIAVYFRFSRFLSIRNLDLSLLILLSTAIVLTGVYRSAPVDLTSAAAHDSENRTTAESPETTDQQPRDPAVPSVEIIAEGSGDAAAVSPSQSADQSPEESGANYSWAPVMLMGLTVLLLIRLIFDESLTRRPRLDQNLNHAGITFLCIPAFAILMGSVLKYDPSESTFKAVEHGRALLERRDVKVDPQKNDEAQPTPTATLIAAGGAAVAQLSGNLPQSPDNHTEDTGTAEEWLARILVIIAHTLVVAGLLTIGRQHFASLQLGIAMSCLYLLLPCTAVNVHELSHVLPAACLIWAIASYRNPVVSGVLLGLASGTLFFAAFLLPLWAVFYGRKGGVKFVVSVLGVGAVLITTLLLISGDANSFTNKLVTTANWTAYRLFDDSAADGDASLSQLFIRIPMAAIFFVMLTAMTVLPRPRNLENLLSNSTSLVVAAQMWYPDDIGTYVLWYLPLFLIVIFRPRLDRFTPPEATERESAAITTPQPASPPSSIAMSRLSFFTTRSRLKI